MAIFCYVYYNNYVSPATTSVSAVMSAALKLPPLQQVRLSCEGWAQYLAAGGLAVMSATLKLPPLQQVRLESRVWLQGWLPVDLPATGAAGVSAVQLCPADLFHSRTRPPGNLHLNLSTAGAAGAPVKRTCCIVQMH